MILGRFLTPSLQEVSRGVLGMFYFLSRPADEIFRTGIEDLVAESKTIVAGPISKLEIKVLKQSEGPHSIPLEWEVIGEVKEIQILKGGPMAGPISFLRKERSIFLQPDPSTSYWETSYGNLAPDGYVILFFGDGAPKPIIKVLPSGIDEWNLISVVQDILRILTQDNPELQLQVWSQYLIQGQNDVVRKAALRALVHGNMQWSLLGPVMEHLLKSPQYSPDLRSYCFAIIVFGFTLGKWKINREAVLYLLCRVFQTEQDPSLTISFLDSIGALLDYADDEDYIQERRPIRERMLDCLRQRPTLGMGPVEPELAQEYQEAYTSYMNR